MNKEILIVTLNWENIGGAYRRAELLKRNFSKKYNVEHIFLNSYLKFNLLKFKKILVNIQGIFRFIKKIREYKIIIAFSNLPSLISLFAGRNIITVITGSTFNYKEAKLFSKIYWILILEPIIYLFAKRIVPAAPHLIPFYVKKTFLNKKVKYINGLIDLDKLKKDSYPEKYNDKKFSGINLENCICLSSALIAHKGILELLEIYSLYRRKLKKNYLKLIIIGNGPLLEDCFHFCRKKGLNYQFKGNFFNKKNDIFFTGHLENPIYIIQKCRIFVMPSFHEGLSNQLLEAIYSGIPIIASNCPGNTFVYSEIGKENPDYINSHFLKLMSVIKNQKIKSEWAKELIFYSKKLKRIKYKNTIKLLKNFSSKVNFKKWEILIYRILESEKIN